MSETLAEYTFQKLSNACWTARERVFTVYGETFAHESDTCSRMDYRDKLVQMMELLTRLIDYLNKPKVDYKSVVTTCGEMTTIQNSEKRWKDYIRQFGVAGSEMEDSLENVVVCFSATIAAGNFGKEENPIAKKFNDKIRARNNQSNAEK